MKVFVFDSAKCNGCYGCQLACKDEHWNNEWLPYSKPQPDTGHFWCKMTQVDHGQTPKVRVEYAPRFCNHCDSCKLIDYAPDCVWRTEEGFVIIDPVKAAGRKDLVDVCDCGSVYWNSELEIPQKCTGCAHLVKEGQLPHCVDMCATGALRFGDYEEFADELAQAETLADSARGPHVFYLNMPHLFIGGEVWDPVSDEVVEGATVSLSGAAEMLVESDEFGDFWFRKIDAGDYRVTVEAVGYEPVSREVHLTKSLNIGDIPLKRTADNVFEERKVEPGAFETEAPVGVPDVAVVEIGDVTAAMSVMSQAPDSDGGVMSKEGIARNWGEMR